MVASKARSPGTRQSAATGTFAPPRLAAGLLERETLCLRLTRAMAQSHVWVQGAAGCGKTTALAQALQGRRPAALWLRLDAMDGDAAVWFERVAHVFAHGRARNPSGDLRYGPEHASDLAFFARQFFRNLWNAWAGKRVWVLDDVHELAADVQEIVLPVLLQEAPPGLAVVLAGRGAPGPAFARAVANRELQVITGQDLRFTDTQAVALFAQELGERATPEQARDWCKAFDGWAAGLVAACTALQRPGFEGAQSVVHGLESVALLQYLAAEGFAHLPTAAQNLLLHTAYLQRFTAAQAAGLVCCTDAPALLAGLLRHQGFLESSPPFFRVHTVFRRFLQARWQSDGAQTEQRASVMRQSAELLEADGQWIEAAQLCVALGDTRAHADLVQRQAPALLAQGHDHSVVQIVGAQPKGLDAWSEHPRVLFWLAQALSVSDAPKASAVARAALHACKKANDAVGGFLASGTLLTLLRTQRTEVPDALALAQRCESDYLQLRASLPPPLQPYAIAAYLAALSTQHHGGAIAGEVLAALLDGLQAPTNGQLQLRWLTVLHEQCYIRQEPAQVHRLEALAQSLCGHPHVRDAARLDWWLELARARVYQRRLTEADAALDQAGTLLARLDDGVMRCQVHAWRLIVRCRQGRARECQDVPLSTTPSFAQAPVLVRATVYWAEGNVCLHLLQHRAALEQFDAAIQCYEQAGASPEQGPMIWLGQSVARLYLGYHDGALQSLQPLLQSAVGGASRARLQAYALAVQACVAINRSAPDAPDLLHRCWSALRATDYRDVMQGGDSWVAELCAHALRQNIEPEFVDAVVRHRQLAAPAHAPQHWPYPVRIRCLGQWELQTEQPQASDRGLRTSLELLHRVLAQAPAAVPTDVLIAELWPGEGREGAQKAFDAALHRLRKRLGCDEALHLAQRQLSLHPGWVWVDLLTLEQRLEAAYLGPSETDTALAFCEDVLDLYRGHLLPGLDQASLLLRRRALWQRVCNSVQAALGSADSSEAERAQRLQQRLRHLRAQEPEAAPLHT